MSLSLKAENLSFGYSQGAAPVLSGVSLSLEPGERVGLAAASGRGKTTLCKLLAGYERPHGGSVMLNGKPLAEYIGYCPVQMIWQHPEHAVNPRLKMRAVLEDGDHISQRIVDALGIEPGWYGRYPAELSGGELQRFCIARALGERTKYLLADEITTMLDLITQGQLWRFLVDEVTRRNIGLLVVSHSAPLLEKVCTRIETL